MRSYSSGGIFGSLRPCSAMIVSTAPTSPFRGCSSARTPGPPLGRAADDTAARPDLQLARKVLASDATHFHHCCRPSVKAVFVKADESHIGVFCRKSCTNSGAAGVHDRRIWSLQRLRLVKAVFDREEFTGVVELVFVRP